MGDYILIFFIIFTYKNTLDFTRLPYASNCGDVFLFYPKGTSSLRSGRFLEKRNKNRHGSRIAPLTRSFTVAGGVLCTIIGGRHPELDSG